MAKDLEHTGAVTLRWSTRILIWAVPFALILVGALGASSISSTFDTRVFLGEGNPRLSVLREFEEVFGRTSTVYLISNFGGRTVLESPFPAALTDLLESAETIEYVRRVDGLVNFSIPVSAPDGTLHREDLLPFAIRNEDPDLLRRPDVLGALVSHELDVAGTVLTFDLPVGEPGLVRSTYGSLMGLIREMESAYPGLSIRMTGEIPLMYSFGIAAADDSALLIPLSILVVLVVAGWCLRSPWFVFCLFVAVLASVAVSLGIFGALGMNFNSTTAILPIVLLVVVMANGLHLLWAIRHQSLRIGCNVPASGLLYPSSFRIPVMISGGTTALGFFMMLGADAPPFRELGLFSGIGTIVGTVLLLAWLPHAIRTKRTNAPNVIRTSAEVLGSWLYLVGRGKWVRLSLAVTALVALGGLSLLSVNDDFVSYFSQKYPIRGDSMYASENLGGPNYLEFWIDSGSPQGALDPAFVSRVRDFTGWLRERPEISNVSSVYDSLQDLSLQIGSGDLRSMTSEEIAQTMLFYEIGLPMGHQLSERIDHDQKSVRVSALLRIGSSSEMIALEEAAKSKFRSLSGENHELVVTGINIPTAYMSYQNTVDMVASLLGTLMIISLGLGLGYRRWSVFFVSIVAIGLPIVLGFGVWGWVFGEIGLASSAIMAIAMGIVIDDTVHIVHRFVVLRRVAASSEQLVVGAMREISPPIVTTSIMLAAGFGVLAFSGFGVNVTLGLCTSLIVLIALLVNLSIVPAVMERSVIQDRLLGAKGKVAH